MSQILLEDSFHISPKVVASKKKVGDTSTTINDSVFTTKYLDSDKPVQIIEGSIEVDEELLVPNVVYPIELRDETFYIRKIKDGVVEVFQLSE